MQHWGCDNAAVLSDGPGAQDDMTSSAAIALVKFQAAMVGMPELQRLVRARGTTQGRRLLCFTDTGYTKQAAGYAELLGMCLFTYDGTGAQMVPRTRAARALMKDARRRDAAAAARQRQQPPGNGHAPELAPLTAGSPPANAPLTTSPLVAGLPSNKLPNATAAGCLAVLTLIAATLLQVGVLDAVAQPDGLTLLIAVVALLGVGAYIVGVLALFMAVITCRREGRQAAPAAAVVVSSAPGVALWIAMGLYINSDQGSAAGLVQAGIMIAPILALVAAALWPLTPRP